MANFPGQKLLGVDVSVVDTIAKHELGLHFTDQLGRTFVYVQANGSGVAAGDAVKLLANTVVASCGNNDQLYGVAPAAIAADGYGWVQTRGKVNAKVATSTAQYAVLSRLAITGAKLQAVPAAANAGDQDVIGKTLAAESGGLADVFLV